MLREGAIEAIKASPLAAFIGSVLAGVPWGPLSYLLASVYSLMLIAQLGHKWFKAWRRGKHSS